MASTVVTPRCPSCGTKFPGDPCKKCHKDPVEAREAKAPNMPKATRKRVKHGRRGVRRG